MRRRATSAFTLIELLVVMAIVSLLLAVAAPRYFQSLDKARETTLKQDLAVMREAIDRHYGDTGRYPESLDELVAKKYLRRVPPDPITDSAQTWVIVAPPERDLGGVLNVASGAGGVSRDGTPYRDW